MRGARSFRFVLFAVLLGACQPRSAAESVPPVAPEPAASSEPAASTAPAVEPPAPDAALDEDPWPTDPDLLIDHLNTWDRKRLSRHAREKAKGDKPSDGETAGWVDERIRALLDMGVEVRWSDYAGRYMRKGPSKPTPAGTVVKPCKRKGAARMRKRGKSREYVDDIEVGCTEAEVLAAHGEPSVRDRNRWTYAFPEHCTDFRTTVTVVFQDGRVATVDRNHAHTGDHCDFDM